MTPKGRVSLTPCGCSALMTMALSAKRAVHCTAYHLILQREKLLTPDFDAPTALIVRRGCAVVREAWTDVSDGSAGRRAICRENETFRQI